MPHEAGRTILDDIVSARRLSLEETRSAVPLEQVQQMAEARQERRDFAEALTAADGPGAGPRVARNLRNSSGPHLRAGSCGRIIGAAKSPADMPGPVHRPFPC